MFCDDIKIDIKIFMKSFLTEIYRLIEYGVGVVFVRIVLVRHV